MQIITHWPAKSKLDRLSELPEIVAQDVYRQLTEPFENESIAKVFWEETSTILIILQPHDSIQQLKRYDAWQNIEFALSYPEYITSLKMDYRLVLAIANDSGSGIYLVIPPQLLHILPE